MNQNQKGSALVLALILLAVISVMALSMTFLSQSETWSTMNYRLMSQARDAAEGGINNTANYLINTYVAPTDTSATDPISAYNVNTTPVQNGAGNTSLNDVYLSAETSVQAANYPVSSVQTAYNASGAGKGSLTAGNITINYATFAKMISMRQVVPYGTTTKMTIQRWLITSDASIAGVQGATVRVSAIMDRPAAPTFSYAAFGTSPNCSPDGLLFGGGGQTDSYDSSTYSGHGTPATTSTDGDVGTNGNLSLQGTSTHVDGSLSTPRTGVGTCASGAAESVSGNPTLADGQVQLPQTINYPQPAFPTSPALGNPIPSQSSSGSCGSLPNCTQNGAAKLKDMTLAPGSFGDLSLTAGATIHLTAGTYTVNSISLAGNSSVVIDSGPVIFQVAGCASVSATPAIPTGCATFEATPLDFTGGSFTNSTYNPINFQIQYAGDSNCPATASACNNLKMNGGAASAAVIYAPNATVTLKGGFDLWGSVIAASVDDSGGANIHYDKNLQKLAFSIANYLLQAFTWSKF